MAHKSMEMMSNLDQSTIEAANSLIVELETTIEEGNLPSESKVKKLNDMF